MSDETIELNTKNLESLIKALKAEGRQMPTARVGILGDKTTRAKGEKTNAEIGAKHEYGLDGLPVRSFLRMPIAEKLQNYLEKSGAFDDRTMTKVAKEGSVKAWVEKIGLSGVAVVLDAFATGGFGLWKPSNMNRKKVKQTLVETQQLRNSITSDVK